MDFVDNVMKILNEILVNIIENLGKIEYILKP